MANSTRCEYPVFPRPLHGVDYDTRQFRPGEPVCLRNQVPGIAERGIYVAPVPQPGTGNVYTHIISSPGFPGRWVPWESVGKVIHPVSKTAVTKLFENKNLPENIEREVQKYGGGRRRRRATRRRKSTRRGSTRRY